MLVPKDWLIDGLRAKTNSIKYFGLGFIQLKIDDKVRYHFYTDKLPSIMPEEEVHNHRYSFNSTIMKGMLIQEIYSVEYDSNYTIDQFRGSDYYWTHRDWQVSCDPNKKAERTYALCCRATLLCTQYLKAGSNYFIDTEAFHKVKSKGDAISLVTRGKVGKDFANVIRLPDAKEVCPFSVEIPEQKLWEIVRGML